MSLVSYRGFGVFKRKRMPGVAARSGRHPASAGNQAETAADSTETAVKSGSPCAMGPDARPVIAG